MPISWDLNHLFSELVAVDLAAQPIAGFQTGTDCTHSHLARRSRGAWRLVVSPHFDFLQMIQNPMHLRVHEVSPNCRFETQLYLCRRKFNCTLDCRLVYSFVRDLNEPMRSWLKLCQVLCTEFVPPANIMWSLMPIYKEWFLSRNISESASPEPAPCSWYRNSKLSW